MVQNAEVSRHYFVLQTSTGWNVNSISVVGNDDDCTLHEIIINWGQGLTKYVYIHMTLVRLEYIEMED